MIISRKTIGTLCNLNNLVIPNPRMPIFNHFSSDFFFGIDRIPPDNGDTTQPLAKIHTTVYRPCIEGQESAVTIKWYGHETN